jgi:hypothetical protein
MDIPLLGGGSTALPDLGGIDMDELERGVRDLLLVCADCGTIEHIPAFDGPVERNEPFQARIRKHLVPLADSTATHSIATTTVNAKLWAENEEFRKYIAQTISDATKTGDVGFGHEFYDLKSTFAEDAMDCWRHKHGRTENCGDYKSEKMRLLADTREERRDLGLSVKSKDRPVGSYLCMFCPYHSIVMQRARKAQGIY